MAGRAQATKQQATSIELCPQPQHHDDGRRRILLVPQTEISIPDNDREISRVLPTFPSFARLLTLLFLSWLSTFAAAADEIPSA